ncbi:MAG: mevalonate kinase [Tuberibacillus sp.]
MMKTARGEASGKLILIGEHAVVHGHPAIALPFTPLTVSAEVMETEGPLAIDCRLYRGPLWDAPEILHGLSQCINEMLKRFGERAQGMMIRLDSAIPLGRGLGSSAAVAAATVRGLFKYFGKPLTHEVLMELVNISEVFAHGNPSGIDSEAVTAEHAIWFRKGYRPERISVHTPVHLVVADSGEEGDTFVAVQSVKERMASDPDMVRASLSHLGQLADEARLALHKGNVMHLGQVMNEAQGELTNIGVSNDLLNDLIGAARKAGALGAKLTGSGRGGCIFAIAEEEDNVGKISDALRKLGAQAVWSFTLRKDMYI